MLVFPRPPPMEGHHHFCHQIDRPCGDFCQAAWYREFDAALQDSFELIGHSKHSKIWSIPWDQTSVSLWPDPAVKQRRNSSSSLLWKEFVLANSVFDSIRYQRRYGTLTNIQMQISRWYITAQDEWWEEHIWRFPDGVEPFDIIISDRIPPFNQEVRTVLNEHHCVARSSEKIDAPSTDQNHPVHILLGSRSQYAPNVTDMTYTFSAHHIESMGLHITDYISTMAEALACMYWRVRIDGKGVKFILAPPPRDFGAGSPAKPLSSPIIGEHLLWMFSFERCERLEINEKGVSEAARTFWKNDPYFPRPCSTEEKDQMHWNQFKASFVQTSKLIFGKSGGSVDNGKARYVDLWVELVEKGPME